MVSLCYEKQRIKNGLIVFSFVSNRVVTVNCNWIEFFLNELGLDKKLIKKIKIVDSRKKGAYVLNGGTSYEIGLPFSMSEFLVCAGLAHELVHVKQYENRELVDGKNGECFWYGKKLIENKNNYWDMPYEIEARDLSGVLLDKIQSFLFLSLTNPVSNIQRSYYEKQKA